MRRLVARAIAPLLIAPFLVFASALAPQHVHEPGPGHDHDHAVAHSHFGPHDSHAHASDVTEIEHDDDDAAIVWLDSTALPATTASIAPAVVSAPLDGVLAPVIRQWTAIEADGHAPAHGPPKPHVLFRGPPAPRLS